MITRAYENAKGERQEVTLPDEVWAAITEVDLDRILGFAEVEEPEAVAAEEEPAKPVKAKKPSKAAKK